MTFDRSDVAQRPLQWVCVRQPVRAHHLHEAIDASYDAVVRKLPKKDRPKPS